MYFWAYDLMCAFHNSSHRADRTTASEEKDGGADDYETVPEGGPNEPMVW